MTVSTPETKEELYAKRTIGELLASPPPTSVEHYIADGPCAGDVVVLGLGAVNPSIDYGFLDSRGIHGIKYSNVEQEAVVFTGRAFRILLVWDTMYCSRDPDTSDVGFTFPRVVREPVGAPDMDADFAEWWDWQAMDCGFVTEGTEQEWSEFGLLCELTVQDVCDLVGVGQFGGSRHQGVNS